VSIRPSDNTRNGLIALSCELGRRYADWDEFQARIFTSRVAAGNSGLGGDISGNIPPEVLAAVPAIYAVSRAGKTVGQSLMYRDDPSSTDVTVDVNLGSSPDIAKREK
jgi:hypothetical protein